MLGCYIALCLEKATRMGTLVIKKCEMPQRIAYSCIWVARDDLPSSNILLSKIIFELGTSSSLFG